MDTIVIVLEATAQMASKFEHLRTNYLEPLIKTKQHVQWGLVLYGDYPPYSHETVQNCLLTKDSQLLLKKINGISLRNGGFERNALGEALVSCGHVSFD
jgi:hypothetical protein